MTFAVSIVSILLEWTSSTLSLLNGLLHPATASVSWRLTLAVSFATELTRYS